MFFISLNCFQPIEKQMQLSGNCFSRSCVCTRNVKLGIESPSHQTRPNTEHFLFENVTKFIWWLPVLNLYDFRRIILNSFLQASNQECKNIAFAFPVTELNFYLKLPGFFCSRKLNLPNLIQIINSSAISWIKSDKFRVSPFPFHSLEMAGWFCGFVCGSENPSTCWSLVIGLYFQGISCPCASAHCSFQLCHPAPAYIEPLSPTSLIHAHNPLRDTENCCGLFSGLWENQNYQKLSHIDWPSCCLCFAAASMHS